MKLIIIDCIHSIAGESGLLFYGSNLSTALRESTSNTDKLQVKCYVNEESKHRFSTNKKHLLVRKWYHRFLPVFVFSCDVWQSNASLSTKIPFLLPKTKVVLTVHNWPKDLNDEPGAKFLKHFNKLASRSNAIVCVSEHIYRNVIRFASIGQKQTVIITNGSNVVPDAPPYPTKYKPYLPFIVSIGEVLQQKKYHLLLPLLRDPAIELVIAGRITDKDYAEEIRKMAYNQHVSDRVRFIGAISDSDKAWYFRNCKAFAFPSASVGGGAALLEALRFGKPIFLNDDSPLAEFGADACFYFDGSDAENVFATYTEAFQNFTKSQYTHKLMHRARLYQWSEKAAEYLQLYDNLY
jgi:glycosyltransferase involved in cell wall biosynthesis